MVEQVGRYKIKGQLGKGAMGVVYLAEDTLLNRQAAIKTVELAEDDDAQREFLRNRLLRDARAAAGLSHPNIVAVFDVFEEGNSAYLVLEYVSGETLAAALNRTPVPDSAFTVKVLRAMAAALDYTHARGIVHRDIKPANVMIDLAGTPKIMDFGIARIADTRTTTPTGMVMGTVEYMSPEQVKGETVDGRSDQFALGAVAYRMLAGATMFGQHSLATLAYKTVNEPPPPVCTRNAQLPPAVDAVISKALAKQPGDRYATCGEFVEALAAALSGAVSAVREPTTILTVPRPAPLAPMPAPIPAKKKSRAGLVVVLGVAAAVVLAAGAAIFRPWEKAPAAPAPVAKSAPVRKTPTPAKQARRPVPEAESAAAAATVEKPSSASQPIARPAPPPAEPPPAEAPAPLSDTPQDSAADREVADAPPPPKVQPAAMAAYRQGQELAKSHQFAEAIAAFSEALTIHPDWPSAVFARARALQLSGQCAEAIRDFDAYLRARPKGFNAYAYRGHCLVRLQEDDRALADFEQALALKPDLAAALFGRGLVHMHRGKLQSAITDFDAAIFIAPNYGLAFQARGNTKRKFGDERGARADLARARQLLGK
jgi:serine/threonine-protein kinase